MDGPAGSSGPSTGRSSGSSGPSTGSSAAGPSREGGPSGSGQLGGQRGLELRAARRAPGRRAARPPRRRALDARRAGPRSSGRAYVARAAPASPRVPCAPARSRRRPSRRAARAARARAWGGSLATDGLNLKLSQGRGARARRIGEHGGFAAQRGAGRDIETCGHVVSRYGNGPDLVLASAV